MMVFGTLSLAVPASARPPTAEASAARPTAVYLGPTVLPLLGTGVVVGAEWRLAGGVSVGGELALVDQSPLRLNISTRAQALLGHTFAFGGFTGIRVGTGYRHVFVLGQAYELDGEQAQRTTHLGFPLWTTSAELEVGYDFRAHLDWPIRLSVAPGIHASYPQLDGFGADFSITLRVAWTRWRR